MMIHLSISMVSYLSSLKLHFWCSYQCSCTTLRARISCGRWTGWRNSILWQSRSAVSGEADETRDHLFFQCKFSQQVLKFMSGKVCFPSSCISLVGWLSISVSKPKSDFHISAVLQLCIECGGLWMWGNSGLNLCLLYCVVLRLCICLDLRWNVLKVKPNRYVCEIGKQLCLEW